jgi:SNF2 family DNA or RNA helicase
VQKNLLEFYSLMDIVEDGILGTISEFKTQYNAQITKGLKKRAIFKDMFKAKELIMKLKSIYKPHFLRRTKKEIFEIRSAELSKSPLEACQLPLKTDLVVWVPLSPIQKKIYSLILEEDEVETAKRQDSKKHIFIVLIALKHLCVHPFILLHSFCNFFRPYPILVDRNYADITPEDETEALGSDLKGIAPSDEMTADDIDEDDDESTQKKKREEITKTQAILSTKLGLRYIKRQIEELFEIKEAQEWMRASNKVEFLFKLLKELKSTGHKVLIFSKTKILLNLVERIIKQETDY